MTVNCRVEEVIARKTAQSGAIAGEALRHVTVICAFIGSVPTSHDPHARQNAEMAIGACYDLARLFGLTEEDVDGVAAAFQQDLQDCKAMVF